MPKPTSETESPEALLRAAHVWLCRLERDSLEALACASRTLLNAAECERADRFQRDEDRATFEIAHALVRQSLARYADVPARAWTFDTNRWGRPEVSGPPGAPRLAFSLSHTRGLVACAVTDGAACGVDVENLARRGDPLRIAARVLSASERADLEARPAEQRRRRLLEYWTLKEAYLKARGTGMSVAMRDLSFAIAGGAARLEAVEPQASAGPEAWSFVCARPSAEHLLAIALGPPDGPSRTVRVREGLPSFQDR
jgi:4'-phosphopantetheinyl transferase